ncbi:MAG: hypothetical protein QG635_1881, partial [Bacteroidota bacterium]|nr:hypothetical protein [Bacteroidota bacterium]
PIRIQGEYAAKCEVSGKLADISVNKLDIKGNDTKLLIKSRFLNVFNPDKFKFDTKIESAEINYTELSRLLPDIDFAPIPDFKNMIIEETNIFGKPDSISVKLNSRCALANIKFNGGIGIKSSDLSYSGNLELTNLNLQPILKSSEFVSTINANIEVKGSGTEFDKIKSSILLKLENSRIGNITVDNCNLACSVHDKGIISLDTFNIILDNRIDKESFYTDDFSKISASGLLNLQQPLKPLYEINCEFKGLNLRKILKNNAVPQFLGGAITLNGSGFEPDSIECLLNAAISDCMFGDRSLMGFDTRLSVERFEGNNRAIHINSDYLKLDLDGDFTINNLVASLVRQSLCIANFAMNKAKAFIPEDSVKIDTVPLIADSAGFFPADFTISANVKDISPVGALVDGLSLFVNSDFKIHYHSDFESCKVSIDSMKINNFGINVPGVSIIANNAFIKGGYYIERTDSAPKVRNMDMRFLSNSSVNISGSLFSKPKVSLELIGENAAINASSTFNQQVGFYSSGLLEFKNGSGLEMLIDSLSVSYADLFRWHNTGRLISLDFERSGFNIKDLALIRDNAEQLFVTGRIGVSHTDNFKILLKNYNLSDALKWIPDNKDKMLNTLSGKVDSISILIHGDYTAPIIEAGISCDNLSFAGINFGNLRSGLTYRNSRISGNLSLFNKAINPNEDLLTAEIKAIPVDLSITDIKDRFHRRFPIDIRTRIRKLPLELISPFVRQVAENLAGYAEGTLDIGGYLPDEFVYNGNIGITEAAFTLLPTSIRYYAEGDIKVDEDKIIIDKIELKNTGDISSRGNATLSGSMIIDKFIPKELDFSIAASNLTVLSDASVRNLPTLYGDLVISTGEKNLRFYGTLSQPNIEGDIDIMKADLKLPQLGGASQTAHSAFKYIIKQKGKIIYSGTDSIPTNFSKSKSQKTGSAGQSDGGGANFADLMDFNINVRFLGKCDVKMDLGTLSQLYAEIGTSDRTEAINYVKRRNDKQAYLYGGDIFVKKGSTLKLYKLLNTSGKVSFPAGSMDNPGLDLVADYNGQTTTKDKTRNFTVRAFLTGTKNNPNIRFTYLIDGEEATGDTTQITSDAIFLMLVGKKKSDYLENNSQGNFLMDLGSDVTNSGLSMVGSKFLTDVLSGSGIIQNADIDFGGGDPKIKFSGQLFGNVRWKFGGTVLDLMGNNEFSIEMPLGAFFNTDYQIDAQFSHSTNESGSQSLDRKDWEVKLKVGKTW